MVKRFGAMTAIVAMLAAMLSMGTATAYHEGDGATHAWADARFEDRWARTDEPVASGQAIRTWIWGPSPYTPGMLEPYEEAPDGERLVQYTDKSRMELNDPDSTDNSIWVVTQGLLALDMMWGRVQVGDDAFVDHSEGPSMENVAGDPGADNGPTYVTMAGLIDADAHAEGTVLTERLAQDGTITVEAGLAAYGVTAAENVTEDWIDHTVASVFWDFMNSQGVIWDGSAYATGYLFGEDTGMAQPFYAVGYPTTEAYWAEVRVGGTAKNVLIQCFERRCLTYTPDNPVGWQVEAGNVGQHYYRWLQTHDGTEPTPPFDVLTDGLLNPRGVHVGPDGTVYIAEVGTAGDICIDVVLDEDTEETGEFCAGMTGRITAWTGTEYEVVASGLPSLYSDVVDDFSGVHDVYVTATGEIYAIIGLGAPPEVRGMFPDDAGDDFGWLVRIEDDGSYTLIADVAAYEADDNPDGGAIDSNPYSLVVVDDGFVVSDAGGNSVLWVSADGTMIETLAVFGTRMVLAPPFLELDEGALIPMESVPTGVAIGPDGDIYVGELTGFPFQPGAARVWRITADEEPEIYVDGFTNIIDIAFDEDGDLLVLEIVAGGLLGAGDDPRGRLTHVEQGTLDETVLLHDGLVFPAGVAVGTENMLYLTNFAVMPNAQLIAFESPLP